MELSTRLKNKLCSLKKIYIVVPMDATVEIFFSVDRSQIAGGVPSIARANELQFIRAHYM